MRAGRMFENESGQISALGVVTLSLLAGTVRYIHMLAVEKHKFSWLQVAHNLGSAAFAGYLTLEACSYYLLTSHATGVVVGLVAYTAPLSLQIATTVLSRILRAKFNDIG